jgi:hypothetical protein
VEHKQAESVPLMNETTQTASLMDNSQTALQQYIAAGTSDYHP